MWKALPTLALATALLAAAPATWPAQAVTANGSVAALFQSGADEPLTYGFTANAIATLQALGLTSGGVALSYAIAADTVTASAPAGNTVFTFQLTAAGNWTFTLVDQLDHAAGNNENDLTINLGAIVQATDFDGDSVTGTAAGLVITVNDDTPVATAGTSVGTVDEDGVFEGTPNNGPGDGIPGGPGDFVDPNTDGDNDKSTVTGSVSALFQSGADEPLTYSLSTDTNGLTAQGLTSGGVALTYSVVGNVLTAEAGAGNTVFTFTLNGGTGAWIFNLEDQLDHPTLDGLPGDNTENDLTILLGSLIQATDFDGDTVTANAGGLVVTVNDDTPIRTGPISSGTVDEDGVVEGAADAGPGDGIAGGTGDFVDPNTDGDNDETTVTGTIAGLAEFQSGADEPLTFSLVTDTSALEAQNLTSGGVALTYSLVGNVLTAEAGAGNTVFTFTLNPGGAWVFNLEDQLDHPSLDGLAGDNTENDLTIFLGSLIQATDADGDTAPGGAVQIVVNDDTPIATAGTSTGTVDEDGVVEGIADAGPGDGIAGGPAGDGDVAGQATVATGSVAGLFQSGADEPLTYSLSGNFAALIAQDLGSGGVDLSYSLVSGASVDTVTASAPAGNTVFTFALDKTTGAWTFTLIDQLDHDPGNLENDLTIQLGSLIQASDFDGDTVTAIGSVSVLVDDDTPIATAGTSTGTVDEDGVLEGAANAGPGDGIAGGTGDVAGQAVTATGSVVGLFQSGADEPLTYGFTGTAIATLQALGLTSGGVALSYSIAADTVTASAPAGNTVFTFQLTAAGNWTFTLVDQLDHAAGNNENDLLINLGAIVQATDFDGDSVPGAAAGLVITVNDDTPIATAGTSTGTVDEDGVLEGAANAGPGDGIAGGTGDVAGQAVTATGSVVGLFQSGADEPLTYGFTGTAIATLQALGLTSGGVALSYSIAADTVTASAPAGNTVFTFQLTAAGNWTFTLVDQLDHAALNGLAGDNTENDLLINLGAIVQATDFDGDSVPGAAAGLVITVNDDTPIATAGTSTGTVDEDGVLEGAANAGPGDGIAGGTGDVAGQAVTATGSVVGLFQSGADEPLTYGFTGTAIATLQALGLTSGGVALSYSIAADTVTASAPAGNTVFTFQLTAAGNWTFTLVDQLDHAAGGQNIENDLLINLGAIVQATDFDGDSVPGAAAGLVITVNDDTPIATAGTSTGTVDEDGVLEGAANAGPGDGIAGGTGDVAGQAVTATGSVVGLFQSGADEPLTYGFTGTAIATLQALGLTSGGVALSYSIAADTVTASAPAGNTVFTFQLTAAGNWTFTLVDQLDHAAGR